MHGDQMPLITSFVLKLLVTIRTAEHRWFPTFYAYVELEARLGLVFTSTLHARV